MFIHDDFFFNFSFWLYSGIGWNRSNSTNFLNNYFIWSDTKSGVEPELFQGKGDFMELEYFGKHFVKNTRNKGPAEKNVGVFSPRYS